MRALPAVVALLALSGCVLAVPPAAGAGMGVMIGASRKGDGASVAGHAIVGGAVGTAIDAVLLVILLNQTKRINYELPPARPPGR